jgi:hypothetical protein
VSEIVRVLDARRGALMERLELVMEMDAVGEGSATGVQLDFLLDEMRHLRDLYRLLLEEAVSSR